MHIVRIAGDAIDARSDGDIEEKICIEAVIEDDNNLSNSMREIRIKSIKSASNLKRYFFHFLLAILSLHLVSRLQVYRFIESLPIILRLSLQLSVEI